MRPLFLLLRLSGELLKEKLAKLQEVKCVNFPGLRRAKQKVQKLKNKVIKGEQKDLRKISRRRSSMSYILFFF